jgi:pilus assembly protein Flp/PilA
MTRLHKLARSLFRQDAGSVFVEYLLLVTLVGLGVMVGLTTLRVALINELIDLAEAIELITL